jgi:NADH dehydrogenase [ubiquinone] 1 alpha subcomplex assembly factor 3
MWNVDPPVLPEGGTLVDAWKGWEADRLAVFASVVPRPEILLFGTGESVLPVPKRIKDYVSSLGIQLDVMDSVSLSYFRKSGSADFQRNAASTYNLLTEEGRTIGAALCPLSPIDPRSGKPR